MSNSKGVAREFGMAFQAHVKLVCTQAQVFCGYGSLLVGVSSYMRGHTAEFLHKNTSCGPK